MTLLIARSISEVLTPAPSTDRLIGVPNAQPPQPTDWEVRPTHRIHHVPYHLAQFWDRGVRQRVEDKTSRLAAARKQQQRKTGSATGLAAGEVPRDLREMAKRSPVVRGWARALEEPVRTYLVGQRQREDDAVAGDSAAEEMDSEDEELVFVGRDGAMRELREKREGWKMARREVAQETVDSGMVFDSFGSDETAAVKSVYSWLCWTPMMLTGAQALACPHHFGLLRPRVTLRDAPESLAPRCLRRPQASRPAGGIATTTASMGALLNTVTRTVRFGCRSRTSSLGRRYHEGREPDRIGHCGLRHCLSSNTHVLETMKKHAVTSPLRDGYLLEHHRACLSFPHPRSSLDDCQYSNPV